MSFAELNDDQKKQLRETYICNHMENPSWSDLFNAEEIVTDKMLEEEFGQVYFVEEDFC